MSLHFLLKAEARTLSLVKVLGMKDAEAFRVVPALALGRRGGCPHCGVIHRHYFRPVRMIWLYAACRHDFTVWGTIFAHHKQPLRIYMAAVILFVHAIKGISALQVGRDLDVSHKTAFALLHKIRESLLIGRDESALAGVVHDCS